MKHLLFGRYSGPLIAFGGLLAIACLASTWYINRLQSDLAQTVHHDATRLETAEELQIVLRQLRLHTLVNTAAPSAKRREEVENDRQQLAAALAVAYRETSLPGDRALLDTLVESYQNYEAALSADAIAPDKSLSSTELIRWSDSHPVRPLLVPCRELADRQRQQMIASLERSESQTTWAGRLLLGLGLTGALGGLVAGYATARGLRSQAAHLSVRVRAVQAQLDQEVGELTLERPQIADLDRQLDVVIGRVKDVCQRLQDQERDLLRAEQLAAVGHLAAGVAHEIRNPLTGIKFLVEAALREANPTPLNGEDLQLIRQEILRMERTIQGLLDFARTPPLERRLMDLRSIVDEATNLARGRAEARRVSVNVQCPATPILACIDRDRMLSLFSNLLQNAIEASPAGSCIEIAAHAVANDSVQVDIRDAGPGIDPTIADRLGTPFVTTKATGTGLGLTIADRATRDHGGVLLAANRPEGGACFSVRIPVRGTK